MARRSPRKRAERSGEEGNPWAEIAAGAEVAVQWTEFVEQHVLGYRQAATTAGFLVDSKGSAETLAGMLNDLGVERINMIEMPNRPGTWSVGFPTSQLEKADSIVRIARSKQQGHLNI